MKYIHLLIFYLFSLSFVLFAEELTTLKKYIENYPKFDKTAATKAAEREYESKGFRLAKINEEIDITSKIGVRLKGKYYGQKASGAIKIGRHSIQWVDIPDDKKYMFLEKLFKIKHDNFVKQYVIAQGRKYVAKRREDIRNYKAKILASDKNIMAPDETILYNIKIKEKDAWKVCLLSKGKEYTFFYKDLLPKESMKIKSGINIIAKPKAWYDDSKGIIYKDIKMISRTPVEICFYDSHGNEQKEKFRDLSVATQQYFKYSLAEENKYLEQLREKKREKEREKKERIEKIKKRKALIELQFGCWDGSHYKLTEYIKKHMNDPDSYKHVKTAYSDCGSYLLVKTTFRGKNAFGGYVKQTVIAKVNLKGDVIKIIVGF